jgi:hypothetical protein
MAGVKITNFLGTAPKMSPELLPNSAAQIAKNCKLYSGDIIPYPQPVVAGSTDRLGEIRTLYALRNPFTQALQWLSWPNYIDIAVASATQDDEQRFYYTGDGVPKVSNYELAVEGGAPPFPRDYYELGLPTPPDSQQLTTVAATFTTKTTSSYARDASNVATVVTSAPHGLRSNNSVTVSGFTYVNGTYTQGGSTRTGSYSQNADTTSNTITISDHGLTTGTIVQLEFSGHSGFNGGYTASVVDKDRFAITFSTVGTRSGTVTWTNAGATTITVTINNHGLSEGASVTLDFTSGTAVDGVYTATNVGTNTFDIVVTNPVSTSGSVKWDIRNFNATNVECTVVNSTTFTYFSPGPKVNTTSNSSGKVDLGGLTQARSYVFTWYTPWKEESIASKPSDDLFIKEGTTVTVSSIPTVKPAGNNFVRGVRLYRTLSAASGTEYYRLATLWFPNGLTRVRRQSNVSRVQTLYPHNLDLDERFKISGSSISSFNITGGIVTDVIDQYTFEYAQTGANVSDSAVVTGTLFYDVSEDPPTSAARYWGDGGNYNFTDDFESRDLFDILDTDEFDAPPDELQGLASIQNNILVGFVGNTLYFSEPAKPHAWPRSYAVILEYNIVGIAAISGSLFVTTESYPYIISGSDPAAGMSVSRIDAQFPCLNKNSMVTMGYGIVYSTHDGLAVYSPSIGPTVITKMLYNNDTWQTALDPTTVIAEYYGDAYFASHSTGSFVFERDEKVGGYFVDTTYAFTASYYDTLTGKLYYTVGGNGDIFEWDDLAQPPTTVQWKSKVITTKDYLNLGAARVVADYTTTTILWNNATTNWETTTSLWSGVDPITFKLYANKSLVYETTLVNSEIFRLPTGYRTDTYEVEVMGNLRIRSVHLAETPLGLKAA